MSKEKGDFHKFHRKEAGSRTVEGNTSGARAMRLEQERLKAEEEFEQQKLQTISDSKQQHASLNINSKFQSARIGTTEEQAFKAKTFGLVTAEEFAKATNEKEGTAAAASGNDRELTPQEQQALAKKKLLQAKKIAKKKKRKRKQMKQQAALLSFGGDGNDDEHNNNDDDNNNDNNNNGDEHYADNDQPNTATTTKTKIRKTKDPTIDTSFLPDKERETAMIQKRLDLEQEWKQKQEQMQQEKLQITFSYWDGSGHRRNCTIKKGDTVGDFLEIVRQDICRDFRELKNVASDALLYVKEDLILPHDISFYDLIATKARGKSGPLFRFDVKDDIRTGAIDVRVEKDESHPGKVVERSWYEKHKHIFPASRWEVYDPSKNYGGYTIAGKIVTTKNNQHNVFASSSAAAAVKWK